MTGQDELAAMLRAVPLFSDLGSGELAFASRSARLLKIQAGEVVVREGGPADSLFVVESGRLAVTSHVGEGELPIAWLGPGDVFGEMALVSGEPRSATVRAESDAVLVGLDAGAFAALMARAPGLRKKAERMAASRRAGGIHPFEQIAHTVYRLGDGDATMRIGRAAECELVLDHPDVGRQHALLSRRGGELSIAPGRGDWRPLVDGRPVQERSLAEGEPFFVGPFQVFVRGDEVRLYQPPMGASIEADGLGREVAGGRWILREVSFALEPGQLVAIVGPSGAGKSTLLHLLIGLDRADAGEVRFDGNPLHEHLAWLRRSLGYVPQNDIVHQELTVAESLRYAARLRLPADMTREEVETRVARAIAEVGLERAADTLVANLSGGQRKRACTAVELLSEPRILCLDEPTSGLDPALDSQLMRQFRQLADEGRTVVLSTHATRNVKLCDRVIVMHDGRLRFFGTPDELLVHFGVDDIAEVYDALADGRETAEPVAQPAAARSTAPAERRPLAHVRKRPFGQQYLGLMARDLRVLRRDRLNLLLRLFGAPLLAITLLLTFENTIFHLQLADGGSARQAVTFLYLAGIISLFFSAFTAANVITRENEIYRRERLIGVSPAPYVLAKLTILSAFVVAQSALVVAVLSAGMDFPGPAAGTSAELFGGLALASLAGMAMGLLLSALSVNPDRAAILVVLAIIPQLVFAGSTVPRSEMSLVSKGISDVTMTKWEVELFGMATGLDERVNVQRERTVPIAGGGTTPLTIEDPFANAFKGARAWRWLALGGFFALFGAGTFLVQWRKGPR